MKQTSCYCICTANVLRMYCVQDEYTMEPAPQPSNGISGEKKSWMGRKPRVSILPSLLSQTLFVVVVVKRNTRQHIRPLTVSQPTIAMTLRILFFSVTAGCLLAGMLVLHLHYTDALFLPVKEKTGCMLKSALSV